MQMRSQGAPQAYARLNHKLASEDGRTRLKSLYWQHIKLGAKSRQSTVIWGNIVMLKVESDEPIKHSVAKTAKTVYTLRLSFDVGLLERQAYNYYSWLQLPSSSRF